MSGAERRLRCYAALLLHNTPHDRGRKQPLSLAGNPSCVRGSEKGIILLSGHNGVAIRFRRIKSSQSFGSLMGLGANEPRVLRADRLVIPEVPELFLLPR